jgi:hypothetical protein
MIGRLLGKKDKPAPPRATRLIRALPRAWSWQNAQQSGDRQSSRLAHFQILLPGEENRRNAAIVGYLLGLAVPSILRLMPPADQTVDARHVNMI